jgi:hypothetical protein
MRMAAGNVKRLTLELGGKGPNIVLDDADLDLAADGTLFGCLMNQGRSTSSWNRARASKARAGPTAPPPRPRSKRPGAACATSRGQNQAEAEAKPRPVRENEPQ